MSEPVNRLREIFQGETPGYNFVIRIIAALHLWDDLIDKDKPIPDATINAVMHYLLIELPFDPFYQKHGQTIGPVLMNAVVNWHVANNLEEQNFGLEHAYVLRTSYVDVVSMVLAIEKGLSYTISVGRLLRVEMNRETFADYLSNLEKEKAAWADSSTA